MNFKRILVLVMTLVMIVSACAPAIHATAAAIDHDHSTNEEPKKEINYVSLGDSMTNGYGLDGYDSKGANGFLELAPESYPAKFAAWLAGLKDSRDYQVSKNPPQYYFNGENTKVTLMQLATSAVRPEDLLYILQADPNMFFELDQNAWNAPYDLEKFGIGTEYAGDYWTVDELLDHSSRWGKNLFPDDFSKNGWAAYVAATYQSAVRDADIISLAAGNSNFGVFLMGRLLNLVGLGSAEDLADDRANYGYMTLENALELCEFNEEMTSLVNKMYAKFNAVLTAKGLPVSMVNEMCDLIAYTVASYVVSYSDLLDRIVELNPDVELMIVPLVNNVLDFNIDVVHNGTTINVNVGEILSMLYTPLNAYIAGLPATKQLQNEYEDAKFYYAELPTDENGETVQVETFAQTFDTLYAPVENGVTEATYPAGRYFCHTRFVGDIQDFVFPIFFGGESSDFVGTFTADDVKAYEIALANGTEAFAQYVLANQDSSKPQLIAYYLGIVDAVLLSLKSTPEVNTNDLKGAGAGIFAILGPSVDGVVEAIAKNCANRVEKDPADIEGKVYEFIVKTMIMPKLSEEMGTELDYPTTVTLLATKAELAEYQTMALGGAEGIANLSFLPEVMSEELSKVGILQALLSVYGRLKFAWGISAHPSAAGHQTLADSLINAYENEYTVQDETIENVKESLVIIAGLVAEFYDEAYAFGYKYADTHGYTDKAVSLIDRVINRIGRVDLSDNTMTDEFRADLTVELDAIVETLKELKEVIKTDKAQDVPGLIATLRALKDDVLTHVKNIYALCEQAGIDVNQLVILPAIYEILEMIETEVIPAVMEALEVIVEQAVEYITEKLQAIYGEIEPILGAANEILTEIVRVVFEIYSGVENAVELAGNVYNAIVDFLVENGDDIEYAVKVAAHVFVALVQFIIDNQEEIEDALEIAGKAFMFMLKAAAFVYVNKDEIVEFATDVYTTLVNFLVESQATIEEALRIAGLAFDFVVEAVTFVYDNYDDVYEVATRVYAELLRTIDRVHGLVDSALDLYDYVIDVLVDVFGSVENAIAVAEKIYNRILKLAVQYKDDLDALVGEAYKLYEEILAIIVETYGETQDAIYTAKQVYKHLVNVAYAINVEIKETIYEATNGAYELKDESAYVALGNSTYGEELAGMLNLGDKFSQFTVDEDYSEAVAGADLVTIKVNNGEFYEFAYTQIMGTVANVIRSNEDLIGWCNNPWIGDKVYAEIESYGIDLEAQVEELEWSKYLMEEDIEVLEAFLARVKLEVLALGIPETIELDITSEIEGILIAEGLLLPGVEVVIEPVVINVADLVVYAVENLLYSYAQFVERTAVLLDEVRALSPDATIVITHVANPLDLMPFDISSLVPDFDEYAKVLDYAVGALNVYLYGLAFVNENTIFVDSEEASDIYDALHVHCEHVYDDCLDTDCNRCLQVRVAPGHSFTHYVNNNDQTCTKNGTATAKCDNCDATNTVTINGSAIGHKWQDATCTTPKTCLNCGETSGKALGHKYDNSCDTDCNVCGVSRKTTHKFGDWEITKKPTLFNDGERTRVCTVCGYSETEAYKPESEVNVVAIVALAMGSIIVAFGASTAIILLIQKKKEK